MRDVRSTERNFQAISNVSVCIFWVFARPIWRRKIVVVLSQHTTLSINIKDKLSNQLRLVHLQIFFLNRSAFGAYVSDSEFIGAIRLMRERLDEIELKSV